MMVNSTDSHHARDNRDYESSSGQQPTIGESGYLPALRQSPRTSQTNGNNATTTPRSPALVSRRSHSPVRAASGSRPQQTSETSPLQRAQSPGRSSTRTPEALINELEAEHEYITNGLLRKVDQLRAEKFQLENAMEAEQEMLVNRLQRQMSLRRSQSDPDDQTMTTPGPTPTAAAPLTSPNRFAERPLFHSRASSASSSADVRAGQAALPNSGSIDSTHTELLHTLEQVKAENHYLKSQLATAQNRISTLSQLTSAWRTEALQLRARVGMDTQAQAAGPGGASNLTMNDRLSTSSELSPPLNNNGFHLSASPPEGVPLRRSSDARGDLNELRELRELRRRPSQA